MKTVHVKETKHLDISQMKMIVTGIQRTLVVVHTIYKSLQQRPNQIGVSLSHLNTKQHVHYLMISSSLKNSQKIILDDIIYDTI